MTSKSHAVTDLSTNHADTSQQPGPDISALNQELQQQWDHARNWHLGSIVITKFSNRNVWWICDKCPDGHIHRWQSFVKTRSYGTGCPQCSGRKLCKHNSLATVAPATAAVWDSVKNGCTPDMVMAHSSKPAHWHCKTCNHKWVIGPGTKARLNSGCPRCNRGAPGKPRKSHPTFAESQHPLLATEWDFERNAADGIFPTTVSLASAKKVHWSCHQCPLGQQHLWTAKPAQRVCHLQGCPYCAGRIVCKCNSLELLFPSIAAEWNYELNLGTPRDYTVSSASLVWWKTTQRGAWQQTIKSRTNVAFVLAARKKYVRDTP